MILIGIDAGTTSCKVAAFNEYGKQVCVSRKEYPVFHPQPQWVETSVGDIWKAVLEGLTYVAEQVKDEILGISISSQGEGVIPLNRKFTALGPVIVSYDGRSKEQTRKLRDQLGSYYFFKKGGQILSSMGTITKIMWMQEHQEFRQAYYYMCVGDYLLFRLTGVRAIDPSLGARTMLLDLENEKNYCWNEELLETIGVKKEQLSAVLSSGTAVGTLIKEVAEQTGLSAKITVSVGGHDQPCAKLGAGAYGLAEAVYSLGTTESLVCSSKTMVKDLYSLGLPSYPHVIPGQFITLPGNFTGGNLLQWYKNQFGRWEQEEADRKGISPYELLMNEMEEVPSGLLVQPHFTVSGSPYNDSDSYGAIVGLRLDTTKGQFIRGLEEGVTYETLLNLRLLQSLGLTPKRFYAVGGGTKSLKRMQLKADILGKPIWKSSVTEASARGAAMLAGKGIGMIDQIEHSYRLDETSSVIIEPREEYTKRYEELFKRYCRLYPVLKKVME